MPDNMLPNADNHEREDRIKFIKSDYPLTMEWVPRHYRMYALNENEVGRISSNSSTLPFVFCGITSGVFASFLSVIIGGSVADPKKFGACVAITIVTGILAAFFLLDGLFKERRDRHTREQIKSGGIIESPSPDAFKKPIDT